MASISYLRILLTEQQWFQYIVDKIFSPSDFNPALGNFLGKTPHCEGNIGLYQFFVIGVVLIALNSIYKAGIHNKCPSMLHARGSTSIPELLKLPLNLCTRYHHYTKSRFSGRNVEFLHDSKKFTSRISRTTTNSLYDPHNNDPFQIF